MVEKNSYWKIVTHFVLILGIGVMIFPLYVALAGSTHDAAVLLREVPLTFGNKFISNYRDALFDGVAGIPVIVMLGNSLVMALGIAIGKIIISIIAAYAIVYFRFPGRGICFALIFMTLMLPVEVRIIPTFSVVANFGLLDSYAGLTIPLIASATATFLFRQFFMTLPNELIEAARIDGAGPIRFFWDIVLPLSKTNIAALFVILFIYGWNQYLWPLLITTDESMYTIVMGIQRLSNVSDSMIHWNRVMATSVLSLLPPVVVVLVLQRQFVRGLIEQEK